MDPDFPESKHTEGDWCEVQHNFKFKRRYCLDNLIDKEDLSTIMTHLDKKYSTPHPFHSEYVKYKRGSRKKKKGTHQMPPDTNTCDSLESSRSRT